MSNSSRSVVITGTSKGIGLALATRFLQKGYRVYGCSRSASTLADDHYLHFELDVADEGKVREMVAEVSKREEKIDGLLNNAGMASMNHLLLTPVATVEKLWRTNFLGSFLFLREVAKVMTRKGGGAIVNFTTVAVPLDLEGEMAYASSKAALESLTRVAARELFNHGVTVNAVGPGPTPTDLIRGVPDEKMQGLLNRLPTRRYSTVEEVCHATEFFLDPRSAGITGQILYLGGVS